MKTSILISTLIILLCSCTKKEESCFSSFNYFKGNIRMSYYLKFNSSDTVYFYDRYPLGKKGTYYILLEKSTKKELERIVCEFKFPKDSVMINTEIEDGTTIAFGIGKKRLMLHGNKGPKEFWNFEKWIDSIQFHNPLKLTKRKVKFENFDNMLPIPPILKEVTSKQQLIGTWETVGKELLTLDISKNLLTYREHNESHQYKINNDSIYIYYSDFIQSGKPYFINDDTLVISTKEGKLKYIRKK